MTRQLWSTLVLLLTVASRVTAREQSSPGTWDVRSPKRCRRYRVRGFDWCSAESSCAETCESKRNQSPRKHVKCSTNC